jgi:hypothetical protein
VGCQWRRWSGFGFVMKRRIRKVGEERKKERDGEERK